MKAGLRMGRGTVRAHEQTPPLMRPTSVHLLWFVAVALRSARHVAPHLDRGWPSDSHPPPG